METGVQVGDAMTQKPIAIQQGATVTQAAKLMHEHNVGSLLVMDGKTLMGIMTERDITRRVIAQGHDPKDMSVDTIMSQNIISVKPHIDIFEALMIFNDFDIRHAPVLHEGELQGFLTFKDIMKIQPDLFELMVGNFTLREEDNKPIINRQGDVKPYFE